MAARGTSAQALFPSSVILTHVFAGNGGRGTLCSALVVSDTLMRHGKDASSAEHELWEVAGKDARKDDSFWARQMGSGQTRAEQDHCGCPGEHASVPQANPCPGIDQGSGGSKGHAMSA